MRPLLAQLPLRRADLRKHEEGPGSIPALKKGKENMNLRKLGKTNRMVSEIGLGTWQLGTRWGDPFNEAEAMKILEASYDSGINLIDTADIYNDGNSEKAIGKFLGKL